MFHTLYGSRLMFTHRTGRLLKRLNVPAYEVRCAYLLHHRISGEIILPFFPYEWFYTGRALTQSHSYKTLYRNYLSA